MGTSAARPLPLFERLLIESQSNCNRHCWFCPRTYDRTGKYRTASADDVVRRMPTRKILDLLDQAVSLGFRGPVGFHHFSEPLLDPRILELARAARDRGLQPYVHTNGDLLKQRADLCRDLADVYHRIVVGLYDYRNDVERMAEERFWRDRLVGPQVEFSALGFEGRRSGKSMAIPKAQVPSDPRMSIPDLVYPNAPCHRPLVRLIVQHDGDVSNCCEDTTGAFALGSVYDMSLEEIWFGDGHLQLVRDLMDGHRGKYALCRQCPVGPSGQRPDGQPLEFFPRRQAGRRLGQVSNPNRRGG